MAIPVARVHLAMAHAALPGLLPSPPKCEMLLLLPTPPCVAVILPKSAAAKKPSRADSDDRWDAHKTNKPGSPASSLGSSPSSSSGPRPADSVRSSAAGRRNATAPPCRADSVERWDAHKNPASPASSSSSSSSGMSSSSPASKRASPPARRCGATMRDSSKRPVSRASSAERWDANKKPRPPLAEALELDDGESSSTGSNDVDLEEEAEEEIVYRPPPPRTMYAGPGFAAASPEPSVLPVPTAFLVRVA